MLAFILLTAASPIDEVWTLERAFWDATARRDDRAYRELWHPQLVGWPCGAKVPASAPPPPFERDGVQRVYALEGKVATQAPGLVSTFYRLHKQERHPDGRVVNSDYEVTHSWVMTPAGWKVIAGMCRTPE